MSTSVTRRQTLGLFGEALGLAAVVPMLARAQAPAFPKGAVIRTLLKDLAPEDLAGGATLFHEHLQLGADFNQKFSAATAAARAENAFPGSDNAANTKGGAPKGGFGNGGVFNGGVGNGGAGRGGAGRGGAGQAGGRGPDINHDPDLMAAELAKAKADGVACLVDAGHPEMGRDLDFIRQVAMKSQVHIVAGGGFYTQPYYPPEIHTMSEDQLYQALLKQADEENIGVYGEIGSWDEITADERKVFRAVGRAHVATNLSVFTHTGIPGKSALEQLDLLEDQGVKPERVVIGHLGNLVDNDVYVHRAICRRGAFVGFDRQGGNNDAQQVPMVLRLIEAGYASHLMFSADGTSNFGKTLTAFLPKLKAAGATDDVLHRIMIDNPRRFLAFVPRRPRK